MTLFIQDSFIPATWILYVECFILGTLFSMNSMWVIYLLYQGFCSYVPLPGVIYWFSSAFPPPIHLLTPWTSTRFIFFVCALCKLEFMCYWIQLFTCVLIFFPNWNVTWKNAGTLTYWLNFQQLEKSWNILIIQHIFAEGMSISILTTFWLTVYKYEFTYLPSLYHFLGIIFFMSFGSR